MPTKRCCAEVKRCVLRRAMRMPCRPCSKRSERSAAQRAKRSAARADGKHAFSRQRTSSTARRVAARTSSHNGGLLTRAERGRQQEETRREQRTAEAEARTSLRCGISRIDVGGAIAWRESAALVQREWPRTQRALAWGSLAQSHLPAHAAHSFDNMRPAVCSSAR